ncbi:UDENN domain-containing protein [Entamoeba marina]
MNQSPFQRALENTSNQIVQSFSIWGLPHTFSPSKKFSFYNKIQQHQPDLLFKYPKDATIDSKISEFLIPLGVQLQPAKDIQDIIKSQPTLHITFIPTDDPVFLELLNFPSDLVASTSMTSIYSKKQLETTRVYCITTRVPDVLLLSPLLKDFLALDFSFKYQWLQQFYLKTTPLIPKFSYTSTSERLTPFLVNLLKQSTTQSPLLLLQTHAIIRLFSVTKPAGILTMLSALLQGLSVFLLGNTVSLITDCVLGLLPLLSNFSWQGIVIPYVPPHLDEFLESPMPALFGAALPKRSLDVSAFVVAVEHLNPGESVSRVFRNSEKTPEPLPYFDEIFVAIKKIVDEEIGDVLTKKNYPERVNVLNNKTNGRVFAEKIIETLNKLLYSRIENKIEKFCKGKQLDLKTFQEDFPKSTGSHEQFYSEFVMAQHFINWWNSNSERLCSH